MADAILKAWLDRMKAETDPAILLSTDYEVLASNAAYRRLYGPGAIGRRCHQVSHHYPTPCDAHGEDCPLADARSSQRPARALHVHQTPRGPEHVDVKLYPIPDDKGGIQAFLEVMRKVVSASTVAGGAELVGRSPTFNKAIGLLERAAPSDVPVLLLGESGTGKELAAKALHDASPRKDKPFVPVACSGLSEALFESELFGHERGAFTGANQRRIGLVESARGGTLFLDEIGDVPPSMQVKLLRLLESRTFRRVGNSQPIDADFRLVCATHRDLEQQIADGSFRQDLYFRINAFPVTLPPLRARREDIEVLCEHLLEGRLKLHPNTLERLMRYDFPGNVRELRNILQRAELLADGKYICPEHLPEPIQRATAPVLPDPAAAPATDSAETGRYGLSLLADEVVPLEEAERRYLRWALAQHQGDRAALAHALGVSERTLYRKLAALNEGSE